MYVVRDATELRETLASLRDKFMVLIDTMGMSQRDKMVAEQSAMLTGAGKLSRLPLLNATCRGDTLDDVIQAYGGDDLAGVILSKMDEAMSLAPVVDVPSATSSTCSTWPTASGCRKTCICPTGRPSSTRPCASCPRPRRFGSTRWSRPDHGFGGQADQSPTPGGL